MMAPQKVIGRSRLVKISGPRYIALKWKNILICKTWNLRETEFSSRWAITYHYQFDRGLWSFVLQRYCCYIVDCGSSFSLTIHLFFGGCLDLYFLLCFHSFPKERNSDLHEIPIFYNSPMVRVPRRKSMHWRYRSWHCQRCLWTCLEKYEFVDTWSWDGLATCWLLKSSN